MNRFKNIQTLYFLGIGGIGMSALARYFHRMGKEIHGYDLHPTPLTTKLEQEGMFIHYEASPQFIPADVELVIYTPAIPKTNKELVAFRHLNIPMMKRAEAIGVLSQHYFTIAIGGTHGKTTITACVAHLLQSAGIPVVAFIGGIAKNFDSNFVWAPHAEIMIVEADEYDRSLLQIEPDLSLVSSISADHLDIYKDVNDLQETFLTFARKTAKNGTLIVQKNLKTFNRFEGRKTTYGIGDDADVTTDNIVLKEGKFCFTLRIPKEKETTISLEVPGKHSVENALGAAAIAHKMGLSIENIKIGLETFRGVERRFDFKINTPERVYIDDYAHHPDEINATLEAVRMLFPQKKMTVVFQPHLYSRTRDFATAFAQALEKADEILLLPVYPAREQPIEGVDSNIILDKINNKNRQLLDKESLFQWLQTEKPELLLTLGAGDIGLMSDTIEKLLQGE